MRVRVMIGAASAYACIFDDCGTLDVRLEPGRSAVKSLRESAAECEQQAAALTRRAQRIKAAANELETPDNG